MLTVNRPQICLPVGKLAAEVHMACDRTVWDVLHTTLTASSPDEACTFVLTRPSRGRDRTTVLLNKIIWPRPGEVRASPQNLEISADYISRALDAAIDDGRMTGVCLIHTHPRFAGEEGIARFSPRDDWYDLRLFPTLTTGRPQSLCAGIVLGSEPGRVDARVWWNGGSGMNVQPAQVIRIVGPDLTLLETPHSLWRDHLDPGMMDRSTRLWGAAGRRILQNLRVGIVGVGGTGSIALLSLATMGVGKIRAWDKDRVEKENLHRLLGGTKRDIGQFKVECLARRAKDAATARPFGTESIVDWATTRQNLPLLKDLDVIFSCVDRLAPRVPLNDLAYGHLVPVIDMGSRIYPSDDTVDALLTHAHVLSPGNPCAWCTQSITSQRLTREAQGNQRGIEHRAPYGLPMEDTDGIEPSVLPLNMLGVGLALMQFMQVGLKVSNRIPNDLRFFLPAWELDECDLDAQPKCSCVTDIAAGDAVAIRPVE